VFAATPSRTWIERISARGRRAAELRARHPSRVLRHQSLEGEPNAFTRSSGVLPAACASAAGFSVGAVLAAREDFERTVRQWVPARSQERLLRETRVDFDALDVVVVGFRVPSLSWVRLAAVLEHEHFIEAQAQASDSVQRAHGRAQGLLWFALPRTAKPIRVGTLGAGR